MTFELSHFSAALLFALCASIVFGITQRNTPRDMMRYGAYCFALFVGGCHRRRVGDVVDQALGLARRKSA